MDFWFLLFMALIFLWLRNNVLHLLKPKAKKEFKIPKTVNEQRVATVQSIHLYPIKSCHGISVEKAVISNTGFQYDRHWMLVREANGKQRFITARQLPAMVTIRPELGERELLINARGMPTLRIPFAYAYKPETSPEKFFSVGVWKDTTYAADEGKEASEWFSAYLSKENPEDFSKHVSGGSLRLVRYYPKERATVKAESAREAAMISPGTSNEVAFPDAHPFLLVLQESVDEIDRRVENLKVHEQRFRGNIVISGGEGSSALLPFTEENWLTCSIDGASFYCLEPVERCKFTTVDPELGLFHPEQQPLVTVNAKETHAKCLGIGLQHTQESEGKLVRVGSPFYASTK